MRLVILKSLLLALAVPQQLDYCGNVAYMRGEKIGSGGTADGVYRAELGDSRRGVFKFGRSGTAHELLDNECQILRQMKDKGVENVPRCVAQCDDGLLLVPQFNAGVDTVSTLTAESIRDTVSRHAAISKLMMTLAQSVLSASVASSDIQLLANSRTGDLLVIDFDHAVSWANRPFTYLDATLVRSNVQEMLNLMDPQDVAFARESLAVAMAAIGPERAASAAALDVLKNYLPLMD